MRAPCFGNRGAAAIPSRHVLACRTLPGEEKGHKYTTVIDRSPYGQTATELIADVFVPFGYASVGQDFRGTERSEGN